MFRYFVSILSTSDKKMSKNGLLRQMRIDIEGEGQGEHEQNSLLEGTSPQSRRNEIAVISSPTTSNISPNTIALKEAKA